MLPAVQQILTNLNHDNLNPGSLGHAKLISDQQIELLDCSGRKLSTLLPSLSCLIFAYSIKRSTVQMVNKTFSNLKQIQQSEQFLQLRDKAIFESTKNHR